MKDITSKEILKEYLQADLEANFGNKRSSAYRYLKWLRICRYYYLKNNNILGGFAKIMRKYYGDRYGYDFLYSASLGKGYHISHNTGVICMSHSMGDNMIFRNFVVIGESYAGSGCPIVGDNVNFGCGCKVLGPIHIGNNVVIGANAVVTHDVEDNSVVAGIPAKVIRRTKNQWGTRFEDE